VSEKKEPVTWSITVEPPAPPKGFDAAGYVVKPTYDGGNVHHIVWFASLRQASLYCRAMDDRTLTIAATALPDSVKLGDLELYSELRKDGTWTDWPTWPPVQG
jgi:hypothetical protein